MVCISRNKSLWAIILGLALSPGAWGQPGGPKPAPSKEEEEALKAAQLLVLAFEGQPLTEAAQMLVALLRGSGMGPGEGWFHPGQSRYGWKWLAQQHGVPLTGAIPQAKFLGSESQFVRLDRNKDGMLKADDFDWSDRTLFAQQQWMINRFFKMINKSGDGRVSKEDWLKFYEKASAGKDFLTAESLREALTPPPQKMNPADMPHPPTLIRGLFRGEIGSMHEGPKLNDPAPDFSLKTRDGKETIRLSDQFGKKPIVLVFGNFTCGPFRSMYPRVDELAQRYKDQAIFLGVYVREAHPTNGWRMGSNDEAGVTLAQPKTYLERVEVANVCSGKLKMSIPLLVDEIDDRVGHSYSGMPARLYIIDRDGKIAYKAGRGPFGFKADEMEQSLVMLLLDQTRRAGAQLAPEK